MKKLLVVLFVLGCFSAAFAEDTKMTVGVSGTVYGTTYQEAVKSTADSGDFAQARINPLFTISNGTLDVALKLRFDQTFGKDDQAVDADDDAVSSGSRNKNIKIINGYVKTKVDAVAGLTLAGGVMSYDFPIIFSDNMAMLNATYENSLAKIALYYGKTSENDKNSSSDDAEVYIADLTVKLGDTSIRPAFLAYNQGKNASPSTRDDMANYDNSKGYIYALAGNYSAGAFGIDLAAAYAMGNNKATATTTKLSGYAFDIAPYYKLNDSMKVTAFMTMLSGDDASNAKENNSFRFASIDPTSGLNVYRLYILEDGASFAKSSNVCGAAELKYSKDAGYSAYGVAFDAAAGSFTAKIQGAYATANKVASGKKDLGIEFDANVGYALTKGSTLFIESGFLKTGEYFGTSTNNAYYILSGISYSL